MTVTPRRLAAALITTVVAGTLLAGCANIGRPEGGARDETPPEFVRANPTPGSRNVTRPRLDAWFNENIQLDDAFNKVIVSPTQTQAPVVRSLGKHLYVELRDTLMPNTTYTVDFADAIKDLNEGNILDGFALDFSTGPDIDTLRISGMVLEARNLEPAQGMTIGIYSNPTDTSLTRVPFERIARTNQYGQFTVRNLKPGSYAVYALNDVNRDHRWDRSEDVAFLGTLVSPSVEAITVNDTLRATTTDADSVVTRPGVHYMPDDVLLTWFNEGYHPQYLRDHNRPERRKITIGMAAPSDTLPTLRVFGGALDGRDIAEMSVLQRNATNDTLTYWLRDPQILAIDSLTLDIRHEFTDSLDQLVWKNDTIKFFWREPKKKKEKKKEEADSVAPRPDPMQISVATGSTHEVYQPLMLRAVTPIESIDSAGVRLEMMPDSVWLPTSIKPFAPNPKNPVLELVADFERKPGMKYRLTVDSAAVSDIYGLSNKAINHEFTVRNIEEYSGLAFNLQGPDSVGAVVELLDGSDKVVRTAKASSAHRAEFKYITPGTYYARMFLDVNDNGLWDTGNIADSIQPEEVYYYPKKLDLKANWDIEQAWNIYEVALDAQKPYAIKKNKPKLKKGETAPDQEVEYDEWGDPIDPNDPDYRNGMRGNGRQGNRNSGFGGFGGFGGLQQSSGNEAQPRRR